MFKESLIVTTTLVVLVFGEIPVSGPYPPSGWRPQGAPFELPQQRPRVDVEISRERLDFAGQYADTISGQTNSEYLPPKTDVPVQTNNFDDFLKVQGLPTENAAKFSEINSAQLNLGEIINPRQINNFEKSQLQVRPNTNQQSQFSGLIQTPEFVSNQRQPTNEYGSPISQKVDEDNTNDELNYQTRNNFNDRKTSDDNIQDDDNSDNNSQTVSNGQYYILSKDKTLQRVIFTTSQNEDEARTNTFTAQLKYMPVEPIRDPIYAYNDQGQLVRIFKK